MSTIYDIAKETGYSPATVARALRGTGYCSEKSRKIILECADRLHYQPSLSAKTLKDNKSRKILVCFPDICNTFYFKMISGISEELERHGYFPLLASTKASGAVEQQLIQYLQQRYGDGMILLSLNVTKKLIQALNACGMPAVLTSKHDAMGIDEKFDNVYTDTTAGIELATNYLIKLEHKRIAYIGGFRKQTTGQVRLDGYTKAMAAAGLPLEESLVHEGDFTSQCGYDIGVNLLSANHPPTGIVCANDLMAIGFVRACREKGVSIPDDISVIGMDDSEPCTYLTPALSSVVMHEEQLGQNSAKLLMERILEGRSVQKTVRLQPGLAIRESTGPARKHRLSLDL